MCSHSFILVLGHFSARRLGSAVTDRQGTSILEPIVTLLAIQILQLQLAVTALLSVVAELNDSFLVAEHSKCKHA